MYDALLKKKRGMSITKEEMDFIVKGFTSGEIPDYQMSAFLMAVCLNGMTKEETFNLTMSMARSGDIVNLSAIKGRKIDKHSTGGVGDKTTLIVSSLVAALGVPVAKMSGRGLGHTGGTIDKLEAIPGFKTSFTGKEFIDIVNEIGLCISGQSGNLAPADKKIYALRDVTATVDNISLIAASIMSKKIAAGADAILLDVKTGSGAFMKTFEDSVELAKIMVETGEFAGKNTIALITGMDEPLGCAVGNSLEIIEAIETLKGVGPKDLTDICLELAKHMLYLADKGELEECGRLARNAFESGAALDKFLEMVKAQGGDTQYIERPELFEKAKIIHEVKASETGFIFKMDTERLGAASCILGAGRERADSVVDHRAGIKVCAKTGDYVKEGEVIGILYASDINKAIEAEREYISSLMFSNTRPEIKPIIYAVVDKNGITPKHAS